MREYSHRVRTVRAACQVFEQLPQQMVYRERGCRWYLVGSEVSPFPLVGPQWLLLYPVGLGWSPLFPDGLWIVAVISWWVLDACCYFLLCPGWLPFCPYGPWMVTVISQQLKYLHRARTVPGIPSIAPISWRTCLISLGVEDLSEL